MYSKITSHVKLNNMLTEDFMIKSGVRQGDVLSPLLFNIYINDIINTFNTIDSSPPKLIDKDIGCLLYADDLAIISTSSTGLQNSLNKLDNYCSEWKLNVNMSKTKTMCLKTSSKEEDFNIQFKNRTLDKVSTYTYLGMDITSNFSLKTMEKSITDKAKKAMFKLKGLIYNSNLKPKICLKLFDQLITPICLYGSEILGINRINTTNTNTQTGYLV